MSARGRPARHVGLSPALRPEGAPARERARARGTRAGRLLLHGPNDPAWPSCTEKILLCRRRCVGMVLRLSEEAGSGVGGTRETAACSSAMTARGGRSPARTARGGRSPARTARGGGSPAAGAPNFPPRGCAYEDGQDGDHRPRQGGGRILYTILSCSMPKVVFWREAVALPLGEVTSVA